jgi:autophagy-related protein 13
VRTTSLATGAAVGSQSHAGPHTDPLASSSAASSQIIGAAAGGAQPSRADQIVYRFYLKTVGVLVDGRVTHFNKGERKKDRWVSDREA